ncbi:receptor-like protein kinase THESEUS 1 [Senna tora]|uniref:Receptor-like protein kinase THESEUS 1 n=1 Tax=Senna tora TaxID=362788 RepID=A0A835C710_9FABA|nr:receptor-like protein kinase THESEUS 1 [Senna tora]
MLIPSFEIPILSHSTTVVFTKSSLLKLKGNIEEKKPLLWKKIPCRTFIADSQHSTVRFQSQSSVIATINSSNISPIYQSTRIFTVQDKNLWKILNRVEQEISLTYLKTKHFLFRGGGGFFSFTLPKHFCVFSGKICCNKTTAPRDLSGGHGSSFEGRTFIADSQHSTVRFQSQSSVIATINSSNISPIYQSTRIFTAQDKNLWKIQNRVEQEISLTYLQTKHFLFRGGGDFFSFTLSKHFCVFSGKICCNKTTAPRDLSGGHRSSFDAQDKKLWKILNRVEQEISLTYLQTKHFLFRGGGGFFSFTLLKYLCGFSGKICCNETTAPIDLMQRDDGAERSVRWPWILLRW